MPAELIRAMEAFGLVVDRPPRLDGTPTRYRMAGKRSRSGFVVANQVDGKLYATFGTWMDRTQDQKWTNNGAGTEYCSAQWQALALNAEREREKLHAEASRKAAELWNMAKPGEHPYLEKKGVQAHNSRVLRNMLLVPYYAPDGTLATLQQIFPDGKKLLLKHGRISGCCCPIPGDSSRIYICEGFATGATINELTGHKVLVAYSTSNLLPVAKTARQTWPHAKIILAADNDHATEGNPGVKAASSAADAIGAEVVIPECPPGTDFNDMADKALAKRLLLNIPPPIEVMTREDINAVDLSLHLPEAVRNPGGIISMAMEALPKVGAPDIPQFTLATILTVIANAIAGKLVYQRTWPNVYNIKVGGTSLGKSDTDTAMEASLLGHVPPGFYGSTGFASGPAIMRGLEANPRHMIVLDECTNIFKRYQHADPISDGIRDALLEIYSRSGKGINKSYADNRRNIVVDLPCLSLTGNATPVIFDAIREEDFLTGTMQRFDWWFYDGKVLPRSEIDLENRDMLAFAQSIGKICNSIQPIDGNLVTTTGVPVSIGADADCAKILRDWSAEIIEATNAATSDGERGIISRKYHLAIKYALVHIAGTRPVEAIYQPMRAEDIEYGKAVAWMLADWKLNTLLARVCQGDFHRDCELFKAAIAAATKTGNRPTFKLLANRRPALKNWKRKDSEEVIAILVKRGEIVLDESKKPTAYLLAKQGKMDL